MTIKDIAITAGCSPATVYKYAKMVLNKPLKPGVNGNKFNQKDAARIVKAIRASF